MSEIMSDEKDYYTFRCVHCNGPVIVMKSELNCKIFRHGVYKDTFKQVDPHASKELCDRLALEGKIYGCGKPLQLVSVKDGLSGIKVTVVDCGYI